MPIHIMKLQKLVSDKRRIADTYLHHGLVIESRNIYSTLLENINGIRQKSVDPIPSELEEYILETQENLASKLQELDEKIENLRDSDQKTEKEESFSSDKEKSPGYLFQKGIGLRDLGLTDEAFASFQKALDRGYDVHACLVEIYKCQIGKNNIDELVKQLESALNEKSFSEFQRSDLLRRLAFLYEKNDRLKEALELYNQVLEIEPNLSEKLGPRITALEKRVKALEQDEIKTHDPLPAVPGPSIEAEGISLSPLTEELKMEESPALEGNEQANGVDKRIQQLTEENKELRTLLEEYQKRYQDIMNFSTTLQKENRDLKKKLEASAAKTRAKKNGK